jgi:branched-chain amino acid transport system ATP-binding protein
LGLNLKVANLYAGYGAVKILYDVSLHISEGETVVLLGTNGNGKSTLLKSIVGIVRPSAGSIVLEIDGVRTDLVGKRTDQIVDLGVTIIPEGRRLFPMISVEDNLLLGAYCKRSRARIKENLEYCYSALPVLKERRRQPAGSLSGGQQQMVAIARAIMSEPRLLLVDEPSVGLSPLLVSQVISKIGELKRSKTLTVLMAEQNYHEATRIADRGYLIVHGKIAFEGDNMAALQRNEIIQLLYLGA